jgi:drug/metabolite transporter (DMT)-like permease
MEEDVAVMSENTTAWIPNLALITAAFLWGSSFIALKLAFTAFEPMLVIFGRMAVASILFLIVFPKLGASNFRRTDLKYLLFMAFCEPCLYFLFEAKALENTTASQAGIITAMLPLMVALAARPMLSEPLSRRMLAGFVMAIAGACWLSLTGESSQSAPRPALGNLLEFIAMICAAGYFITLKFLTRSYSPWFLTAWQAFVGSLFFFPLMLFTTKALPSPVPLVPTLSIVYLGAFITIGAYGLYNFGISRLPVSQASAYVNLIPVFAVVLGWIVLGEKFTAPQYLAAVLVFAGIYLSQSGRRRNLPAKQADPLPVASDG